MTQQQPAAATLAEQFKAAARPIFGTVSGDAFKGYRVAVRNRTHARQLAALAEQYGGLVDVVAAFPALARVTFPPAEGEQAEDRGAGV